MASVCGTRVAEAARFARLSREDPLYPLRPRIRRRAAVIGLAALLGATACSAAVPSAAQAGGVHPRIGFSIDDLRIGRRSRERDYLVAAARSMGATVTGQSADGSEQRQISQIENLISRGMDVIVIVPFNGRVLGNIVSEARQAGIKVISYDRLILDADIDAYISFDDVRVGQMQAQGVLDTVPKGNYYLLGGAPTDNSAKLLREGQMKVLQPAIDRGAITVVGAQWVPEWSATAALSITENALTANRNDIQGIVGSNDAVAGGAIQALAAQGLAGKVGVSGQDADLSAIKRIVAGTQTTDVYKPLKLIAATAAKVAVQLARGQKPAFNSSIDNGRRDVPTELLMPIVVTRANVDLLITDGFYTRAQVYGR